jgi:hypothetical protein
VSRNVGAGILAGAFVVVAIHCSPDQLPSGGAAITSVDLCVNGRCSQASAAACPDAGPDGGCGAVGSAPPSCTTSADQRSEICTLPPAPVLQANNAAEIRFDASVPAAANQQQLVIIGATGSVSIAADGGLGNSASFLIGADSQGRLAVDALAALGNPGPVVVSSQVGSLRGAPTTFVVSPDAIAVSRIDFQRHRGVMSDDLVTVCVGAPTGVLTASSDAGTLASGTSAVQAVNCGDGYPGTSSFVWTGSSPSETLVFSLQGQQGIPLPVSMPGTDLCLAASVADFNEWQDEPSDAGPLAVDGTVQLLVLRNSGPACSGAPDAPVENTSLMVVAQAPSTQAPSGQVLRTDSSGKVVVSFRAPPGTNQVRLVLQVGGVGAATVTIVRPAG